MTANAADNKVSQKRPPSKKPAAAMPATKKRASTKTSEKITSKADLIRKVAGIIKAKGERPRPTEIARILKEEGVTVAPAQVSMTLKAAGYRPLRKRRQNTKTAETLATKQAGREGPSSRLSMDDLLAAKSVSGAFGGTDKAIAALQALKRLES